MTDGPRLQMSIDANLVGQKTRAWLADRSPEWFVVCGSGIGPELLREPAHWGLEIEDEIALSQLGWPVPSVAGHGHSLVLGQVEGRHVALQTGRLHPYEGHDARACVAVLEAVAGACAERVLLTCACGSLVPELAPGELVFLSDQINLWGPTPLAGPDFVDCSRLYDPELRSEAQSIVRGLGRDPLAEVVYAHARGPQYETPAEVNALAALGGQVVGMSTTYEAVMAARMGARTLGLGLVTNGAGALGLSHAEVQAAAAASRQHLLGLIAALVRGIGSEKQSPG